MIPKSCDLASSSKLTVHRTCPSGVPSSALVTNLMRWLYGSVLRIFAPIWRLCRKKNRKWGQKEMAAIGEGGHFDSALCGSLHFHWRAMTRNALPLSVRHFHPSIGPAFILLERFSRASVPLPLRPPVAMAVSPNTVTFTS